MVIKQKLKLPKISIVIPSHNKQKYIKKTLQSILEQKYPNLEVLIFDGGSTDLTPIIIAQYCQKYPHIFKFESKKDNGQLDAIVKGLKKAKGNILTFINADDVLQPGALLVVGEAFKKNPSLKWLVGFGNIIDQNDKLVAPLVTNYKNALIKINNFQLLLIVNYFTQPATFLSRDIYRKYGPFTGTVNYVMEYHLWLKLGKIGMPFVIPKILASFRLTSDNISSTSFNKLLDLDNKIAQKYTKNRLLISLHKLHNIGRKLMVSK